MLIERRIREEVTGPLHITGVTLLSTEEYEACENFVPMIKGWWWLRSPGCNSIYAATVNKYGRVMTGGNPVDRTGGIVRPALKIENLTSLNLKPRDKIIDYVGYNWTVIPDSMALCNTGDAMHCFRENWKSPHANNYDLSAVKRWLKNWAQKKGMLAD